MIERKCLVLTMDTALKTYGFQRKLSLTWHKDEADLIKGINLQKSAYSNLYYVNLGTFFKGIGGDAPYPKYNDWHVADRVSSHRVGIEKRL